eukprot:2359961-Rhodomonas_salina.1
MEGTTTLSCSEPEITENFRKVAWCKRQRNNGSTAPKTAFHGPHAGNGVPSVGTRSSTAVARSDKKDGRIVCDCHSSKIIKQVHCYAATIKAAPINSYA